MATRARAKQKKSSKINGVKSKESENSNSQFESLSLEENISTAGPLNGNPRKVKDNCIDWYNYLLRWNNFNTTGADVLKKLMNCKLQTLNIILEDDKEESERLSKVDEVESNLTIQEYCDLLDEIYQNMEKLLRKMNRLTNQFEALSELDSYQQTEMSWNNSNRTDSSETSLTNSSSCQNRLPIFHTWPMEHYYKHSKEIVQMFEKELTVKKCILENAAHTTDRDILMFYVATWVHQPYLEDQIKFWTKAMLKETEQ